jgi:hypothetical protein
MPNPSNYPNTDEGYKRYMKDCMHITVHEEHKKPDQGVAQCLNVWREKHGPRHPGKPKKAEDGYQFPHDNYLKDPFNCPVCGERYSSQCRCRMGNKTCPNGHGWHTCDVHDKVFVGDSHNLGALRSGSKCVCPLSEEEKIFTRGKMASRIAHSVLAELSGSEALYGFCGWLTTRDEPTVMSAHDEAGHIAELIGDFCETNELKDPQEHWDDELKHPKEISKTADFPDHPDQVVVTKSEHGLGGPEVTELDVFSYYTDGVITKMLQEFKGRNLFIAVKPREKTPKPIYVRHPYDKKSDYIRIGNEKEFEVYHSGRTVEYHVTMPATCPYYVVDFDAVEDWATTKKITAEVAQFLDKLPEVKKVEIRYSGKRGFHILGWLKKGMPIDTARERLKEHLKETFGDRKDLVLGESPSGKKGALGVSPMKLNGGQVALWSMRVTGLCCVEVPRAKLGSFKKEDARPEKVYKRLTGKTLVPAKKKEAAQRVISAFLKDEMHV